MHGVQQIPRLLYRLWLHLSGHRRRQFVGLLVLSLGGCVAFFVLTSLDRLLAYPIAVQLAQAWGRVTAQQLILPLIVVFAGAALFAGALRMLFLWVGMRLGLTSVTGLVIEFYRRSLCQPCQVHEGTRS